MNRFPHERTLRIAPLRAAARRPAGFVARSSRTASGTHRRSRLASGPGGRQQNANLFLREPLALATAYCLRPLLSPLPRLSWEPWPTGS